MALQQIELSHQRWATRYGWRDLSPLEQHAFYVFWVEIGNRMEIRDIPDTLEGLTAWSRVCPRFVVNEVFTQLENQAYEETYMIPADTNREVAGYTVGELLSHVPETLGMKAFGERATICLMEDTVRESMSCVPSHL